MDAHSPGGSSLLEAMAPTNYGSTQRCSLTYSHTEEMEVPGASELYIPREKKESQDRSLER